MFSMMLKKFRIVTLFCLTLGLHVSTLHATENADTAQLPTDNKLVGSARMTYLFWDVYDARLFTRSGKWESQTSFMLELEYLRDLDGEAIAKRSIEEMRKQGFEDEAILSKWYDTLESILPNVTEGTQLIGFVDERGRTQFYQDGQWLANVDDPLFSKWFFNIWLGEKSSEPELREQLIGMKQ